MELVNLEENKKRYEELITKRSEEVKLSLESLERMLIIEKEMVEILNEYIVDGEDQAAYHFLENIDKELLEQGKAATEMYKQLFN